MKKNKLKTGDVQMHCIVFSSQQKQKDRMETKHPHGCFLCNQLKEKFLEVLMAAFVTAGPGGKKKRNAVLF